MGFEEVEDVGVVRSWGESEGWRKVKQIVGSTLSDSKENGQCISSFGFVGIRVTGSEI
ncbi:unnamed protein product [Prunus armeniaca]|uniref:Uncharacterized protein n=1 Tax=Prunus armeniaca TaxID=36596 RepID=A0A6J5TMA1_PRUAR|nr:unnamed protein product [Prunus armeniaca]